ncbi:MAG: helix-turn-helix domain-containing protein [Clostridia bacterium]|nr:helix-turn-helix domain-containing protein [Clostridia bacterium]
MNEAVTCIYRVGARSTLPQGWQGQNLSLPDSKFYYIEKGEIEMEIYGESFVAGPGDLLLIPAHAVHSCRLTSSRYAEKSWCHFSFKNGINDFFENYSLPPVLHVKDRTAVSRLFRLLFHSHSLPSAQSTLTSTTAICGLVQYYFDNSTVTVHPTVSDRIGRVATYIEEHYTEPLTLEHLAAIANYSPTHLSKRFKEATGLPPIRYLNNIRIEQAKYLLQFSDESIGKIMEKIGFTDTSYFSKFFKKLLGYSPQAFRELYRTAPMKKR